MGVIGLIARLLKLGIGAYALMTLAMLAWTFLWPEPDMDEIKQADVIVCLGAGMTPDGTLDAPVLTRIDRCVQLYEAGLAPFIIFSGGTAAPDGPSAGGQMMRYALSLGAPQSSLIAEPRAQSTLQNALFSLELAIGAQDFIIVTEAFHLPRAWASFQWARWESGEAANKTFQLVMSEDVRRDALTGGVNWRVLVRESVAIWFNGARAAAYSLSTHKPVDWLH